VNGNVQIIANFCILRLCDIGDVFRWEIFWGKIIFFKGFKFFYLNFLFEWLIWRIFKTYFQVKLTPIYLLKIAIWSLNCFKNCKLATKIFKFVS
jgi:hypothetical protein